jgi:hypothetical protein
MSKELVLVHNEKSKNSNSTPTPSRMKRRVLTLTLLLTFLLGGFLISNAINAATIRDQNYLLQTSGLVELSESELRDISRDVSTPIFWAGPITGYSYLLTVDKNGSAIVKYKAPESADQATLNASRQIATYPAKNAWENSLTASAAVGFSSFKNSDGSLVFYSIDNSSDVFMAFPDKELQIEIYDSRAGQALSLSVLVGQIREIE